VSKGDWIAKGENGETYNESGIQMAPDLGICDLAHPTPKFIVNQDPLIRTASRSKCWSP
jgi:hypothetical protein